MGGEEVMPRLRITQPEPGSTYELPCAERAEVVVGTAPYCQLSVPGVVGLAEVHACIVREGAGYVITDLRTRSGTYADGALIRSTTRMMPGVEYRLGELRMALEDEAVCRAAVEVAQEAPQSRPVPEPQVVTQPQVVVPQVVTQPQVLVQQQPASAQQMLLHQPIVVSQPVVVQIAADAAAARVRKAPPTSMQRKREMSVLLARLHRKKRYNYVLWLFLWFFFTMIMVTALVVFVLPGDMKKAVERTLQEKAAAYEREGIPGLLSK